MRSGDEEDAGLPRAAGLQRPESVGFPDADDPEVELERSTSGSNEADARHVVFARWLMFAVIDGMEATVGERFRYCMIVDSQIELKIKDPQPADTQKLQEVCRALGITVPVRVISARRSQAELSATAHRVSAFLQQQLPRFRYAVGPDVFGDDVVLRTTTDPKIDIAIAEVERRFGAEGVVVRRSSDFRGGRAFRPVRRPTRTLNA